MRSLYLAAGLCLALAAPIGAADFWTEKPFLQWSDKDVDKMMSGSPWAGIVAVALPPPPPQPSGDVGGGRGGGRGGGDGFGPGPRRIRLTISWRSAKPVKQAVLRAQVGRDGTITDQQKAFLDQDEPLYVVGVMGLPPQYVRPGGQTSVQAFLHIKDGPTINAEQAGTQMGRGGATLLLGFPRGQIMADDMEVEFEAKFENMTVRKKFKLKDMFFEGKLEL